MHADRTAGFVLSRAFLREVAVWSVPVAVVAAVAGTVITGEPRFGASCLMGAAVDVATVLPAAYPGPDPDEAAARLVGRTGLLFGGRFLIKAVLLALAAAFTGVLDLAGMAAGVLVFETTLITAGAAVSAVRTMRPR
jgi:hypothetical protein